MWGLRTSVSLCNLCPGWCHQLSSPGSPNLYVTSWRHFNISSVKPPKYPNTSSQCCVELVVIGTGIFDSPAHSPIFLSLPFIVCFVLSYLYFNYHTNYLLPIIVSPQKIVILSLSIFIIKKWKIWKIRGTKSSCCSVSGLKTTLDCNVDVVRKLAARLGSYQGRKKEALLLTTKQECLIGNQWVRYHSVLASYTEVSNYDWHDFLKSNVIKHSVINITHILLVQW